MTKALLIIDVQRDFCEGGALACQGGAAVAQAISSYLSTSHGNYQEVIASRDWHTPNDSNQGHFPPPGQEPDFVTNWPLHCLAGSEGAEYHPNLDTGFITTHIKKGQRAHGYSIFDGTTEDQLGFGEFLKQKSIDSVDVVGIATDHCVRASALDAKRHGLRVRVITSLTAGVAPDSTERAVDEMVDAGIEVVARA